ncbi:MAG: MgtC/SapB family protein [Wenzhouxiangellaceae bacterium]|nr:MgtC/SapB family protein [Wenzhouxiangellaceae bacterium]
MDATELVWLQRMAVGLAIGLLVGLERGWQRRAADEGARQLGLRTLGLVGLAGALCGMLAESLGPLALGLPFIGLAVVVAAGYAISARRQQDLGLTTEAATLVTFLLAGTAGLGHLLVASAGAVLMVLLLSYKAQLHGGLQALDRGEVQAALKLLLISVVVLPVLPDQGYGPWQALNPYVIWWMVVLIAAISFVGYFAIRIAGARFGILFTGLFGGLAASTATTLSLARMARKRGSQPALLAAGILLACGTMFPRMLLVATLIHRPLLNELLVAALLMAAVVYGGALWLLIGRDRNPAEAELDPGNPLELRSALTFGALLAVVMLAGEGLTRWLGEAGIYALAAASGVADVDAVTLSLARMAGGDLRLSLAALGIVIAASVNTLVKAGMALAVAGRATGLRVAIPLVLAVVAGLGWLLAG